MTILALQFVYFVIMFSRVLVNNPHNLRPATLLTLDLSVKMALTISWQCRKNALDYVLQVATVQ